MSEWFPWTEHDGKGRPIPLGTYVQVVAQRPTGDRIEVECYADDALGWDWQNYGKVFTDDQDDKIRWLAGRILRYRIRKWRAGEELDKIAAEIINRPCTTQTGSTGDRVVIPYTAWTNR